MDKCWKENNTLKTLSTLYENDSNNINRKPCLIHTKNNLEKSFIKTYAPGIQKFLSEVIKECENSIKSENYIGLNDFVIYRKMEDILGKLQIPEKYILGWLEENKFKGIFTYTIVNDNFMYFKDTDEVYHNIYNRLDYKGNKSPFNGRDEYRAYASHWLPNWAESVSGINSVSAWHWENFPIEDQKDFLLIFYYLGIICRDYYILKWFNKLFRINDISKIPPQNKPPFPEDIFKKKLRHLFELESEFIYKPFNNAINFIKRTAESNGGKSFISNSNYLKKCILEKNYIGWGKEGEFLDKKSNQPEYINWLKPNEGPYNIAMNTPESKYYIFPKEAKNNIMITSDFVFEIPLNKIDKNNIILLNPNSEKTKKYYETVERIMNEFN